MDYAQLAVNGILISPVVFGIVQIAKDLGVVQGQGARVLALVLGLIGAGVYQFVQFHPEYGAIVGAVMFTLAGAMGAMAIYDLSDKQPVGNGK